MKKKTLAGLISSLICISLIGVGFASWVITGDGSVTSENGNIQAETIVDNSITIKNQQWSTGSAAVDNKIYFGAPVGGNNTAGKWLINTAQSTEDLTAEFTFTIDNYEKVQTISGSISCSNDSAYKAALDANVIAKPDVKITNTGASYKAVVTFDWGTEFNNTNPYAFYNQFESDATYEGKGKTYKQHAKDSMPLVFALNGATFTLTITATSKTTAE